MATRVGGPPRGPPPAIVKPGGAPKGPPPGRGKTKAGSATKGGKSAGGASAASNANIPKSPPIAHFICYIKGEPFSAAAGGDIPAIGGDDLDLDAEADIANMSAIVSGLDGGNEPFSLDEPASKPEPAAPAGNIMADPGGLAAMLQA